jgi:hypothetical protein
MAECIPGLPFDAVADLAEGPAVRLQDNITNEIQITALLRTFMVDLSWQIFRYRSLHCQIFSMSKIFAVPAPCVWRDGAAP